MFATLHHLVLPSTRRRNHPPIHQRLTLTRPRYVFGCQDPTALDLTFDIP